ncbi:PepSY domain-containing protein [Microbulbifer bruguierae]|uniref:PepSY domain-containing protein n=1 Tax=Microbulbifer bruguierae TaxID=3029061 RepID=A0ABY8NHH6_9GAMM|nr:PepSY domain-containing protein [Microbulbifer bruguierae]WGL17814.1 PepSY domain-containing protein [Microbulbifer bruguierae]
MKFSAAPLAAYALITGLFAALLAGPLLAAGPDTNGYRPGHSLNVQPLATMRVQNKGISRDQAAALVKRRFGGKILAIKEVQRDGRSVFRVKGLSEKSQVYVVFVDKQTGQISR